MRCSIAELNQIPRMISPNHQPILNDAGKLWTMTSTKTKKKEQSRK